MSRRNDKSARMQQIRSSTGYAGLADPLGIRPNVWLAAIAKKIFETSVGTSKTNVNLLLVKSSLGTVHQGLKRQLAPAWQSAHASISKFVKGPPGTSRTPSIEASKTAQAGPLLFQTLKRTNGVAALAVKPPQTAARLPGLVKPISDHAGSAGYIKRAKGAVPSMCRVL